MRRQFDDLDPVLQDPMYASRFEDPGHSIEDIRFEVWDAMRQEEQITNEEIDVWEAAIMEAKERDFARYFPIFVDDVNAIRKHRKMAPLNEDQITSMRAIERYNRGLK